MSNPLIRIHNMATGEVIDREMTDEEYAAWQIQQTQSGLVASNGLKSKAKQGDSDETK